MLSVLSFVIVERYSRDLCDLLMSKTDESGSPTAKDDASWLRVNSSVSTSNCPLLGVFDEACVFAS